MTMTGQAGCGNRIDASPGRAGGAEISFFQARCDHIRRGNCPKSVGGLCLPRVHSMEKSTWHLNSRCGQRATRSV